MAPDTGSAENLPPIFITVKQTAAMLAISPWSVYQLLDDNAIVSQYHKRRRLVLLESVRDYAASLPTKAPESA